MLTKHKYLSTEAKNQQYVSKSTHCFRQVTSCSELPKKRHNHSIQDRHCCEDMKKLMKSPATGCVRNKNVQSILASNRNLDARDASGHQRVSYLLISPKISSKYNLSCYIDSSDAVSRKENCSRITKAVIRDMTARHLEFGVFHATGQEHAALRLAESRRLSQLTNQPYLNKSKRFRQKIRKIEEHRDRLKTAYPNPSQILAYSQFAYLKLRNGEWNEHEFFETPGIEGEEE